jgi:hypothetical protein
MAGRAGLDGIDPATGINHDMVCVQVRVRWSVLMWEVQVVQRKRSRDSMQLRTLLNYLIRCCTKMHLVLCYADSLI